MKLAVVDGGNEHNLQLDWFGITTVITQQDIKVVILTNIVSPMHGKLLLKTLQKQNANWQLVQKNGLAILHKEKTFRNWERRLVGKGWLYIFDFVTMTIVMPQTGIDQQSAACQVQQISDYLYGQVKPMCLLAMQHLADHLINCGWRHVSYEMNNNVTTITDIPIIKQIMQLDGHGQPLSKNMLVILLHD